MNFEYIGLILSISLSFIIASILFLLIYILVYSKKEVEKASAYECGFHSFEDTRQKFNVRYYLVSILFIIFDLEIALIFPWIESIRLIGIFGYLVLMFFLLILTLGFIYEWLKDALTWE